MKKDKAFELIRVLGKSFREAALERGAIKDTDGFESDLFNGIAAFKILSLTDKDIPGIEKACEIVMEYVTNLAVEDFVKLTAGKGAA